MKKKEETVLTHEEIRDFIVHYVSDTEKKSNAQKHGHWLTS